MKQSRKIFNILEIKRYFSILVYFSEKKHRKQIQLDFFSLSRRILIYHIMTDLLFLQNTDHFTTSLRKSNHGVCRHERQVARSIVGDGNWTLVWTDQLVLAGLHIACPAWTVAFNKRWGGMRL